MGAGGSKLDPSLAPGLTPEEVKNVSSRLARLNNGSKTVPIQVLERELKGIPFARPILHLFDEDGDGSLQDVEVLKAITTLLGTVSEDKKHELIFKIYDKDRDGLLGQKDLEATLVELSAGTIAAGEVELIAAMFLNRFAKSQPGKLDVSEFKTMVRASVSTQLALQAEPVEPPLDSESRQVASSRLPQTRPAALARSQQQQRPASAAQRPPSVAAQQPGGLRAPSSLGQQPPQRPPSVAAQQHRPSSGAIVAQDTVPEQVSQPESRRQSNGPPTTEPSGPSASRGVVSRLSGSGIARQSGSIAAAPEIHRQSVGGSRPASRPGSARNSLTADSIHVDVQ